MHLVVDENKNLLKMIMLLVMENALMLRDISD